MRAADARAEIKVNILFRRYQIEAILILIVIRLARVAASVRSHKMRQIAKIRVRRHIDLAVKVDADFRAAVAAKNGTILNKRHARAKTRRGNRGATSGNAAAYDDQIINLAVRRRWGIGRKIKRLTPQRLDCA